MPDSVLSSKIPVNVPLVNEPWGLFKSLSVARKNLLRILPEVATKQPIVSGKTGKRWHMLMEPTAIREILLDRVGDYPKSDVTKNLLKPAIGESLFIAEGAHWRWQRRAAAPVFTHRNMMNLACPHHDQSCRTIRPAHHRCRATRNQYVGRDGDNHL